MLRLLTESQYTDIAITQNPLLHFLNLAGRGDSPNKWNLFIKRNRKQLKDYYRRSKKNQRSPAYLKFKIGHQLHLIDQIGKQCQFDLAFKSFWVGIRKKYWFIKNWIIMSYVVRQAQVLMQCDHKCLGFYDLKSNKRYIVLWTLV